MSNILSTIKAIKCYNIIEDIVVKHIINNKGDKFFYVISNLRSKIENTSNYFGVEIVCNPRIDEMRMDINLYYNNAILYIDYEFSIDYIFVYSNKTVLVCITDSDCLVKHDITDTIKGR